jgi:hypothetical protein
MSSIQFILFLLTLLFGLMLIGLLIKDFQTGVIGFSKDVSTNSSSLIQDSNVPFLEGFQSQRIIPYHSSQLQEDPEKWYTLGDDVKQRSLSSSTLYSYLHPENESCTRNLACSSCGSFDCNSLSCPLIGRQDWRHYHETPMNYQQDNEIEELREVLNDTIQELNHEEVIPPGTIAGCSKPPIIGPNGMIIASPECRPPGWLRFVEKRNRGLIIDPDEM